MSLTVALVLTAGALLAGLAAHGWWSARRAQPRKADGVVLSDAPLQRVEPTLGAMPETSVDDGPNPMVIAPPPAPRRSTARLDALIDAIATLGVEVPVAGDVVVSHLPASRRAGGKPFFIEGLNAENGQWEAPQAGARYGELQAGVQRANRTGALNEIEY